MNNIATVFKYKNNRLKSHRTNVLLSMFPYARKINIKKVLKCLCPIFYEEEINQ